MDNPILLIIGGSSLAIEIREVVDQYLMDRYSAVYNVIGDDETSVVSNCLRDKELDEFLDKENNVAYIVGFANVALREKFEKFFDERQILPANVVHPSAYIAPSAAVGKGVYLAANSVVSSFVAIENHVLVNYNVTIGHDAKIGRNCIINPGCSVSGNVVVGHSTMLGANSFVFQGKTVGSRCKIDALTYIDRNIADGKICTSRAGKLAVYDDTF